MKIFRDYFQKRFLTEEGIGAPGALPPGGPPGGAAPPMGGPPGGGPPMGGPPGGGLGGPPGGGLGGPPGGGAPGGGDLSGKKPLELKPLNVWQVLEKILGIDKDDGQQK